MPSFEALVTPRCTRSMGHSLKIFVSFVALLLKCRLMPRRSELTAPANVCLAIRISCLQPTNADGRRIRRRQTDLEATVSVEQRGCAAIQLHALAANEEVGDLGAIGGRGLKLLYLAPRGVIERRQALELLLLAGRERRRERVCGRLDVRRRSHPQIIARVCLDARCRQRCEALAAKRLRHGPRARARVVLPEA